MKIPTPLLRFFKKSLPFLFIPILFLFGWWFGLPDKTDQSDQTNQSDQIWTCSMHPQIQQPDPGKCPICGMDLIPLGSGATQTGRKLSISPEAAALLNVQVSPVTRLKNSAQISLFGKLGYDETRTSTITSRIAGRIDHLYADFTGTRVSKNDELASLYSPEIYVAQKELIEARRSEAALSANAAPSLRKIRAQLAHAAREKLRLLDLSTAQIDTIAQQNEPKSQIVILSPQKGIVTKKFVTQGQYLKTGDSLFQIADLSYVWLNMEAYESDLPFLRYAQDVTFQVEALPGQTFHGRISFIDQEINPRQRTARIRVNVENPNGLLKPGMFATATVSAKIGQNGRVFEPALAGKWISPMHPQIIKDHPGKCDICGMDLVPAAELGYGKSPEAAEEKSPLSVPSSALLLTGKRALVYVRTKQHPEPTYEGREVLTGPVVGSRTLILSGLKNGELVVTQGAFKLDSELQLKARPSMMSPQNGDEAMENSAKATPERLEILTKLRAAYLPLAQALANDDAKKAAAEAKKLAAIAKKTDLKKTAQNLAASSDLKAQRREFQIISQNLIALIRSEDRDEVPQTYIAHCPMAFGGEGADWISSEKEIQNPYLDTSMPNCGDITETLSLKK